MEEMAMTDQPNQPVARTRNGDITLDQLGEIQPGLARIMMEVSDRYWILYYSAKAGNWKLAAHESGELKKALNVGGVTRPRYMEDLASFTKGVIAELDRSIKSQDWKSFETLFHKSIVTINDYHSKWGHEEIVWQLPPEPPTHLSLEPRGNRS